MLRDLLQRRLVVLSAAGFLMLATAAFVWGGREEIDFNRDVRPVFNRECIACHGGVKQNAEFSLLFREDALRDTTEDGRPIIVPGDPDASELMRRIGHHDPEERMPLDRAPLSSDEIRRLRRWIRQGAEWEPHWAYVKPQPVEPPDVSDDAWPENDIDRFVLARLDAEGLRPSPPADCAALLRRAGLDLVGLPPALAEVDRFCADRSADAYEKAVDRLLASPRFGEHWAALWLDLARYADTRGYEQDMSRTIWKYRDWVIDAFNADMPFDRFTVEQLAGDLLPGATDAQIVATAFHRNTMNNDEGGTDDEEFRTASVLDRVNTTFEVWQGTTMACVQCHSHPYDPFRHEEYYGLYAFFNNSEDADRQDEYPRHVSYDSVAAGEAERLLGWIREHAPRPGVALNVRSLSERVHRTLAPKRRLEPARPAGSAGVIFEAQLVYPKERVSWIRYAGVDLTGIETVRFDYSAAHPHRIEIRTGSPEGPKLAEVRLAKTQGVGTARVAIAPAAGEQELFLVFHKHPEGTFRLRAISLFEARPELDPATRRELDARLEALAALGGVETPILRELPEGLRRTTHLFERGNWMVKGREIRPGVPASLPPLPAGAPANRLGLAQWLVSPDNPLTARVTVNRFWASVFGTGLVETVEDFGSQGAAPSHPELLDWLALRFMHDHRWSVKQMLREIVLSATYRQSARVTPELLEQDPYNRLLARAPRVRLSAEQTRDAALQAAGLLSPKMHGPSVMPPQPPGIWQVPYSSLQWKTSEGEDRHRRAVYTYWRRTTPYPSMVSFDSPSRELCVSRRVRTNTPLQALVTLNDPVYVEAARALARRMRGEGGKTVEDRLTHGYRLAVSARPAPEALARLRRLYDEAAAHYRARPALARDALRPFDPYAGTAYADASGKPAAPAKPARPETPLPPDSVDAAALTVAASAILNLDRFLTKE